MRQHGVIPLSLILYGALAAAVLLGAWRLHAAVKQSGYDEAKAECIAAAAAQREKEQQQAHTAGSILEAEDGKARIVYRTITKAVDRYIDRPVYRAACLDADGLRDANAALRGSSAAPGESDERVPRPDPSRERDRRDGATKTD